MIEQIQDELLVILNMMGVSFRLYLHCSACGCSFMSKTPLPPAQEPVVCPHCSTVCSGISYARAVGMDEVCSRTVPAKPWLTGQA